MCCACVKFYKREIPVGRNVNFDRLEYVEKRVLIENLNAAKRYASKVMAEGRYKTARFIFDKYVWRKDEGCRWDIECEAVSHNIVIHDALIG